MLSTTTRARAPAASAQAAKLVKAAIVSANASPVGLRMSQVSQHQCTAQRSFSTTRPSQLRDLFPSKDTARIQTTPAAWPHPGYTMEEMLAVVPAHRKPRGFGDWVAWKTVRFARYCMDRATGMDRAQQVDKAHPTTAVVADKPLTEAQWVRAKRCL